jgi:phage terminase large subunit
MAKTYEIEIDYPSVINEAYLPHLNNLKRVQIYYGGSSSGKSVFLAQRDVVKLLTGGRNILVCRQVGRTLRGSVVQEVNKVITEWGLHDLFDVNKTDGTVTCKNGYQIVFAGLDDVEKLKSLTPAKGVFTDIRIEEATEVNKDSVKQLLKRQRGGDIDTPKTLTMSFNPILRSNWIYKEYFAGVGWMDDQKEHQGEGLSIIKTTYKDNRFLTPDDAHDLENENDPYYYAVYTLGNWGVLGHVIFTNWKVEDLSNMADQWTNRRNGLDFGFSSDPAALVCSHYDTKKKIIYFYDEVYETELQNDELASRIIERVKTDRVACDSAEPKSIAELIKYHVNAYAVKKGPDSVDFGIKWLKGQTIVIDSKCINAQNEFSVYHWKEDAGGNQLAIPSDKNNHLIDATRYAFEDDMTETIANYVPDPFAGW